jgi:hypothetical protein
VYGGSQIALHGRRGVRGGFGSNRIQVNQLRVRKDWPATTLVQVCKYAREILRYDGHKFQRGDLLKVKARFPSLSLSCTTVRRCYHDYDKIMSQADALKKIQLGHLAPTSKLPKGCRHTAKQGIVKSCLGPTLETGLWHYELRQQQVAVSAELIGLEFEERLELHKDVIEAVLSEKEFRSQFVWTEYCVV